MNDLLIRSATIKALGTQIGKQLYELERTALESLHSTASAFENRGVPLGESLEKELMSYIMLAYREEKLAQRENNQA